MSTVTVNARVDPICGAGDPNICSLTNLSHVPVDGFAGDTFEFIYTLNDGLGIQLGSDVNPNIHAELFNDRNTDGEPVDVTWSLTMALSDESGALVTGFIPVHENDVCDPGNNGASCGFVGYPSLTPEFENVIFHNIHFICTTSAPTPIPIGVLLHSIEFSSSTGKVQEPPATRRFQVASYTIKLGDAMQATFGGTTINASGLISCIGPDDQRVVAYFLKDGSPVPAPTTTHRGKWGPVFLPKELMGQWTDMLRNEKPVYGYINTEHPEWTSVSTREEPVGEEER